MKGSKPMSNGTAAFNTHQEWHAVTMRLCEDTKRQIAELKQMQAELQQWYSTKPGKPSETLELDECPGLLRVMQTIRLMRETLAELEQELGAGEGRSQR
jgi:hypothetical protein